MKAVQVRVLLFRCFDEGLRNIEDALVTHVDHSSV